MEDPQVFTPLRSSTDEQPYDDDQESESLSLRDLPITAVDHPKTSTSSLNHSRRSSSSSDFFFEFLGGQDHDATASPADDIIFRGHLLPFGAPPPPRRSFSLSSATTRHSPSPGQTRSVVIRPSRSLNCRKIRRDSSSKSKKESFSRNSSKNSENINSSDPKTSNSKLPAWYWLVFGNPVRIPAEMGLKDIKNRQLRRSIPPERQIPGDRRSTSSASWRVLNVLSCKSHASIDVMNTPSFHHNPSSLSNI